MVCNDNRYDELKLQNQICFPLYACSKELIRKYRPYLKDLDLTYTQYLVMLVLWERECVSSKQLSALLYLDYGTLTPVLKRLNQIEYLTRERALEDERLLSLALTEKGRNLKTRAASIPSAIADCMGITWEESAALYNLCNKVLKSLENEKA